MKHTELTDELSEQVALYALGALDEGMASQWETHLASGCRVCQQELAEIQSLLALLAYAVPVAPPPSHLKARLFERVRASLPAGAASVRRHSDIDFASLSWVSLGVPGVSVHWLRRDNATGAVAAFLRIEPGCLFPDHRHPGGEESLVLHGHCRDGRGEYRAGDYIYYEPESVHSGLKALEGDGCIVFVVAPEGIELLSGRS